jgi:hypothetical protein
VIAPDMVGFGFTATGQMALHTRWHAWVQQAVGLLDA